MAELTDHDDAAAQATCCEPLRKAACCGGRARSRLPERPSRRPARERYARRRGALGGGCGTDAADAVLGAPRSFGARALRRRRRRRRSRAAEARLAGLRRPDRRRRPARGRDGARPRLRRRRRRAASPPAASARPARPIGLDMTDEMLELARANAARGRRRERRVPQGLHRGRSRCPTLASTSSSPTASSTSPPTSPRPPRGGPRAAARRALRRLRRHRRPRHGRGDPRRHGAVDRLHRRRAHRGRVPALRSRTRASRTSRSARPTACTSTPGRRSSARVRPTGERQRARVARAAWHRRRPGQRGARTCSARICRRRCWSGWEPTRSFGLVVGGPGHGTADRGGGRPRGTGSLGGQDLLRCLLISE